MGFAYANEHIIQYMNNVKAPYNVNRLTQEVAVRALSDRTLFQERVTAILKVCVCARVCVWQNEISSCAFGGCACAVSPLAVQWSLRATLCTPA